LQAEEVRHDGNWWHQQSAGFRLLYILGFMDGMELGSRFSTPDNPDTARKPNSVGEITRAYEVRTRHYFRDVTVGQIADGLDAFYRDLKNRSIKLTDGFEIVLRSIKGEDVEKLIRARRSSAAAR
jgi:hypothetical protein